LATSWFVVPMTGICGSPLRGSWRTESEWPFISRQTCRYDHCTKQWSPVFAFVWQGEANTVQFRKNNHFSGPRGAILFSHPWPHHLSNSILPPPSYPKAHAGDADCVTDIRASSRRKTRGPVRYTLARRFLKGELTRGFACFEKSGTHNLLLDAFKPFQILPELCCFSHPQSCRQGPQAGFPDILGLRGLPKFRGKKTLEDGKSFRTDVMLDALRVGAGN
jgi:hypothetical protein